MIHPAPIADAPGPEANADVLSTHYRRVQTVFATHAYDSWVFLCHWCLTDEPLTHTKVNDLRGTRTYCSERCSKAYDAYIKSRTVTGRIADQEPNMQNVPAHTDPGDTIRRSFVGKGEQK